VPLEPAECPVCPEVGDDVVEELQKLANLVARLDDPASRILLWVITTLMVVVVAYLAISRVLRVLKKRRKLYVSILAFIVHILFYVCLTFFFFSFS
jgi:undecaprenyl pyrophosphate phosphatase UppP